MIFFYQVYLWGKSDYIHEQQLFREINTQPKARTHLKIKADCSTDSYEINSCLRRNGSIYMRLKLMTLAFKIENGDSQNKFKIIFVFIVISVKEKMA